MSEIKRGVAEDFQSTGNVNFSFEDDNSLVAPKMDVSNSLPNSVPNQDLKRSTEVTVCNTEDICIPAELEVKLYKRRFWNLFLLSLVSMLNAMQWIQYSALADVTMCFYGVGLDAVFWTSNLFFIIYIPLSFPASWLMNRMGLRFVMIMGAICTCAGAVIQCFTLTPGTFSLLMLSQSIAGLGQVFLLSLPAFLAAIWFGSNEVSRACAAGISSSLIGCALSFVLNPYIVSQDCTEKFLISKGKERMAFGLVGSSVVLLILIVATFKDRPEKPPSVAQARKIKEVLNFKDSLLRLLKNADFDLLLVSFGIIYGVNAAVGISLNAIVIKHFPGKDTTVGFIGLTAIILGNTGSIIEGAILDWTHKFKQISIVTYCLAFVSMIIFTGILEIDILWIQFLTTASSGFFMNGFMPIGYEFAIEITYPLPESVSSQLLTASGMAFGLLNTMVAGELLKSYGSLATCSFFASMLLLGILIIVFVKCAPRRIELDAEPLPNRA